MQKVDSMTMKSFFAGIATGLVGFVLAVAGPLASTQALSVQTSRDCDDNAVIRCGATSTTEMHSKYNDSPSAQAIFAHFGISDWNMRNLTKNAQAGSVTKDGRVLVNGRVVATNAMTAGRQNMPGSTQVTSGGVTFYKRPPSASFQQQSLPSFVVLNKDGVFKHAIIASCGNPVSATPKEKPKPEKPEKPEQPQPTPPAPQPPAPQPPAPAATANAVATVTVNQQQQQQQQQAPEVEKPAPPKQKPPQPQPEQPPQTQTQTQAQPVVIPVATQPTSLPKTGISDVIGITVLSSLAGMVLHQLYVRRKLRRAA